MPPQLPLYNYIQTLKLFIIAAYGVDPQPWSQSETPREAHHRFRQSISPACSDILM